jgi:hypothetical protein
VTPMLCASQDAPRVVNVNAESRGETPVRAPACVLCIPGSSFSPNQSPVLKLLLSTLDESVTRASSKTR